MKVLVADKFEQSGMDGLTDAGCDVIYQPDLRDDALTKAIVDTRADVLVVRSTNVTAPMLESGALSLVVRAGAGYNTIDVATASKRGIYVSNCPAKNSIAVAELVFGLILALDRRIPDNVADLRAGKWNKKEYSKARGLYGRTLGLLGFGNIAQEMARRAPAFGMNLVIWSEIGIAVDRRGLPVDLPLLVKLRPSSGFPLEPHVEVCPTPADVAARCDVLSVHVALSNKTKGLVSAEVLERMKPGSYFINAARGEVVDYAALEKVAKEKNLRVALDVFPNEPKDATGEFKASILNLPNVYGTHHIGASTDQAQEAIAAETVRIIKSYKDTGKVPNVVNLAKKTPATHMLVVRHRDRPGVLAHVFGNLRAGELNAQEAENVVFEGAEAAIARITLDSEPPDALLKRIQEGNGDILDLNVVKI